MTSLSALHRSGMDPWTFRQAMRKRVIVDSAERGEPQDVARRVEMLSNQRKELQTMWGVYGDGSDQDREVYEADIRSHDAAILHLESLVDKSIVELLLKGTVCAFGYKSISDLEPSFIAPHEWAFLHLDCKKEQAWCEDGPDYRALRFLMDAEITTPEWLLILDLCHPD
ncbi:MAG: hypothetical protein WCB90_08635, partial [Methanosarcina sp.]